LHEHHADHLAIAKRIATGIHIRPHAKSSGTEETAVKVRGLGARQLAAVPPIAIAIIVLVHVVVAVLVDKLSVTRGLRTLRHGPNLFNGIAVGHIVNGLINKGELKLARAVHLEHLKVIVKALDGELSGRIIGLNHVVAIGAAIVQVLGAGRAAIRIVVVLLGIVVASDPLHVNAIGVRNVKLSGHKVTLDGGKGFDNVATLAPNVQIPNETSRAIARRWWRENAENI